MFIPAEVAMFYFMGIFKTAGSLGSWLVFGIIVLGAYVISVLVDIFVMRKRADLYTEKFHEYQAKRDI